MDSKICPVCCDEVNAKAIKCPKCGARQPDAPGMNRGHGRMLSGVSAMLAFQLAVDPTLVRIGWMVAGVISGGLSIGLYLLLWVVTPPVAHGQAPLSRWLDAMEQLFGLVDPPRRTPPGPRERSPSL